MDLKELEAWFLGRPKWLQDAARRLVHNGSLTDQDLAELYVICASEAIGQAVKYAGLPVGALSVQDMPKPLRLRSIGDVHGINALSPSKPLDFGNAPLCIVYGRNGAGKSGYVRLLKHASGARHPGDLLGNIFIVAAQPQSATITFTEDTKTDNPKWQGEPIPQLRGVEIYDTTCGFEYVDKENEVTFEPWLLRLFTQLTNSCTALSQQIQDRISAQVSKKPVFPAEYATTSAATWYANITYQTNGHEVDARTTWTPQQEIDLTEIRKRLAEGNPTAKAATFRRQKSFLLELVKELRRYFEALAQDKCDAYLQVKSDAVIKRKAANEDANTVFENAPLAGVGSESWRILWEAARKYSEEHAYKTVPFPNTADDARCVLCQRELDPSSRDRFVAFEKFVRGELQRLASEAEQKLQANEALFPQVPTASQLTLRMGAAGIAEDAVMAMVTEFVLAVAARRQTCIVAEEAAQISPSPPPDILALLENSAADKETQAVVFEEDAKAQNRPGLETKGKELSAFKWLHEQRKAIDEEITRLKTVKVLEEIGRLTDTHALSARKSKLTETLITNDYIDRFREELKRLKARSLAVELRKTRAAVGHVYHQISLTKASKNVKTSDILSEGEFRIVSLAAFLADTEGRGSKTPFIFDDPISSLDHVYEDAAALRLIELSKSRQVIVFTHRLSLVGYLRKYAEKRGVETSLLCLSRYITGDVTDLPITLNKTHKAANRMVNERLCEAKKAFTKSDEVYENVAKGICSDIRNLLERVVEKDLINEVVTRFSPEVNTKGKIHALAKVTEEDCTFVDEYMTKYSRYEHSQPDEAPVQLPAPDEIESDLTKIIAFITKIRERNA